MKKSKFGVVYFVVFLDMLGFGIIIPVIRDLTQQLVTNSGLGWPSPEIYMGILMSVYSGSQMISAPFLGRLSDVYGRKPIFLLSAVGNVLSYAIWVCSNTYWPFLLGRILSGITGGNIAIAQSILADHTTPEQRPRAMGLLGACIGMGFVVGPFVGGVMINFNHGIRSKMIDFNPYWVIGAVSAVLSVAALLMISFTHFGAPVEGSLQEGRAGLSGILRSFAVRNGRKLFTTQLLSQLSFVSFEVLFAWILQKQYLFDLKETYYFFGFQGLLLALVQGGLYRRIEKTRPPEHWVKMGLLLSCAGMCVLPWIGYLDPQVILGVSLKVMLLSGLLFFMTLALGFGTPSLNAYASIHAPKNEQGQTMGNMQSLSALARFAAPVLATSLYALWLPLPFLLGGIFCLTAWFVFSRK